MTLFSRLILRTDENGHRWEIRLLADGTAEHRREGRTKWLGGWPLTISRPSEQMIDAKPIRVLLVDDHAMVREGLRAALQPYPNIQVVGEATDGEQAVTAAGKLKPTVIVMDINLSRMDGITATRLIKAQRPDTVIVGISAQTQDYQTYAMKRAGAVDVLKKDNAVHDLYAAIQQAVAAVKPVFILEETSSPVQSRPDPMDEPKTFSPPPLIEET